MTALMAAVLAGGCAGGEPAGGLPALQRPVPAEATKIAGGSPRQRRILRDLLARFDSTGISTIALERPAGVLAPYAEDRRGVMLRVTTELVAARPHARRDRLAYWESQLVVRAFEQRSRVEGLPSLVAAEVQGDGIRLAGPPGSVPRPLPRGPAPRASEVGRHLGAAVRRAGARVAAFRAVSLPDRPAAVIVLEVDDAARFLRAELPFVLPLLPGTYFLEIRDAAGQALLTAGGPAFGMYGVRPELDACSPIPRLGVNLARLRPRACPWAGPRLSVADGVRPRLTLAGVERATRPRRLAGERLVYLRVWRPAGCGGWRVTGCPDGAVWRAQLGRHGQQSDRWLLVDDESGRVIAERRGR